jgi:non-ribosomal peptide synthetase component E (peptide arylation enzyme)
VVFVVLRDPTATIESQAILDTLRSGFERWQLPRLSDILIVSSLPRTGVGKIDKKELRLRL